MRWIVVMLTISATYALPPKNYAIEGQFQEFPPVTAAEGMGAAPALRASTPVHNFPQELCFRPQELWIPPQ